MALGKGVYSDTMGIQEASCKTTAPVDQDHGKVLSRSDGQGILKVLYI
jgi:hypothetical protein